MDTQKILLFTLALFCFDLSYSAPVFNGLLKTTNASDKYEEDFRSEVSVISDNVTTYNVSNDDLMNNLTNSDLPLVLPEKSAVKIGGKGKTGGGGSKNKVTGGGGSKNNKGGSKGGGRISVHRPVRPIRSSDDPIITYIWLGVVGFSAVIGVILGCLKGIYEKDEDENTEEEDKNKDCKDDKEEDVNNNENSEKDKKEDSEILKKKDNKENTYIVENTAL